MAVKFSTDVPAYKAGQIFFEDPNVFPVLEHLGQLPFLIISSGLLNLDTGVSFPGTTHSFIPFRYRVVAAWLNIINLPSTATLVNVGTYADSGNDNILSYAVAADASSGLVDVTASLAGSVGYFDGSPGDVVGFSCANTSTSGGLVFAALGICRLGQI